MDGYTYQWMIDRFVDEFPYVKNDNFLHLSKFLTLFSQVISDIIDQRGIILNQYNNKNNGEKNQMKSI